MNKDVVRRMCTTPFVITTVGNADSSGDAAAGTAVTKYGYVLQTTQIVINDLGKEEVSGIQIYIPGETLSAVAKTSLISVRSYTKKRIIKCAQFDGPGSLPDLGVLYLP